MRRDSADGEVRPDTATADAVGAAQKLARAPAKKDDRRSSERREPVLSRQVAPPHHLLVERELFPRKWPFLLVAMCGAILCSLWAAQSLPAWGPAILLTLSVALVVPVDRVWDAVAVRPLAYRVAGATAVILLPLFLFGLGMTIWARDAGIAWDFVFTALLTVSSIAVVYLRRHAAMIFAAQIALFGAVVFTNISAGAVLGLLAGIGVAVVVTRQQVRQRASETAHRRAQERISSRAQDILTDYEQTGQGWFWETDRRALLTYVSPPVAEALKRAPKTLIGKPLAVLFDMDGSGEEGERTLQFHLSARSSFSELPMKAAIDGDDRYWSVSGRPLYDHFNNFIGFRGSGTDLTERRRSQQDATRLAKYDSLTGLANRFQMSQSLEKVLNSRQGSDRFCSVFLLDLDRFKHVNDTMGHPAGDALLKQVAGRLVRAIGKDGQVGRLGGDEFKVIIPTRVKRDKLEQLARDVINSLSQPYSIDGQRVVIGASVGIATCPDDGMTSEELIRNADLALYAAKDGGRGRLHFYSEELHAEAEARARLEEDLRDALAKGELQMHYQPVVSTSSEQITGFEALMRWQHPEKGWIEPQRFIQLAEDTGLIQPIGEWALRQACADVAQWPADVKVAVNVSPLQFANPQLPAIVANAIANAGIRASQLELEITESVFLSDIANTDAMFAALKKLGVRLALDDFGTGYSSLGYLKKAPFNRIKIDQSFVRGLTEPDSHNGAIITSITSLAQALGMETTAEGVETMDELDLIRHYGCSHVQGYIYERPLDREAALERLEQGLGAVARGPRSARAPRQTLLRKVVLDHNGHLYNGTIRNLSVSGALVQGLWNVPEGTQFIVRLATDFSISCTARWCQDDRMGVEFEIPLQKDHGGNIVALKGAPPVQIDRAQMRKAS
ncbi:diguanylate cyclase [Aurantiacibacter gangjinensis]|uniref:Diguanylate cyclase n=1 Tax=Aurantiacibacter gangjinensis TaxID=502682 RepID=A0A0G9MS67_9SPHN|nr:diguanylate cyclase [Aurantiacibacter gangjinensis]